MIFAITLLLAVSAASACNIACQMNYDPLCGTNGQTYGNGCELEATNCLEKKNVAVAYAGECVPAAACNIACQLNYDPLCGTDGHTYGNGCELEATNCLQKMSVAVYHAGECAPAAECNIACQLNYEPVCGTDGQTYGNGCELDSMACLKKSGLAVAYSGVCAEPMIPVEQSCNEACLRNWEPVCGSDGITYGNLCQMESLACTKRLNLIVAHQGEC
jgi:hypothetical protein